MSATLMVRRIRQGAAGRGLAPGLDIGLRILGAVAGGYAVTALAVAAAGALLARLGMARAEAVVLAAMLGFVAYLVLLLWSFSVKRVTRLWLVLAGGAVAMASLLLWLAR
jgi:hypothetical protein